jgi:hypothetical protein
MLSWDLLAGDLLYVAAFIGAVAVIALVTAFFVMRLWR